MEILSLHLSPKHSQEEQSTKHYSERQIWTITWKRELVWSLLLTSGIQMQKREHCNLCLLRAGTFHVHSCNSSWRELHTTLFKSQEQSKKKLNEKFWILIQADMHALYNTVQFAQTFHFSIAKTETILATFQAVDMIKHLCSSLHIFSPQCDLPAFIVNLHFGFPSLVRNSRFNYCRESCIGK